MRIGEGGSEGMIEMTDLLGEWMGRLWCFTNGVSNLGTFFFFSFLFFLFSWFQMGTF